MNTENTDEFWDYSLKLYNEIKVKDACLSLQNRFNLNINLLLFCCWYSETGRGKLSSSELQTILDGIASWNEGITQGLRRLRLRLTGKTSPTIKTIYSEILNHELMAEKIEQVLIIQNMPGVKSKRRPIQQRGHDALENIYTYYKNAKISLDSKGYTATRAFFACAFPEYPLHDPRQLSLPL